MMNCLLCLALSPFISTYDSTIKTEPGFSVQVGDPIYLSVSYEKPQLQIVGQNVPTKTVGASLGLSQRVSDKTRVFIEGGYYWPSASPLDVVRDEIIRAVLRNDHGPIPFKPGHYDYKLHDGWGGRVGVEFALSKRLSVFGAYRFLKLGEDYRTCNFEEACVWPVPEGGKYWVNKDTRNYSSIQMGVSIRL